MDFKDKVVLITGGSSGIGKALAVQLGIQGAKIAISGRDQDKLEKTTTELRSLNIEVIPICGDVARESDCQNMIDVTVQEFGGLHILINNAGISMRAMFKDLDLDVLRSLMDINFWGTVYCTKFALPHILKEKGSIVAISSIAGRRGLPARIGYSSSKFAMEGFMESLRTELLNTGVHVFVACPGFTDSNIRNTALSSDGTTQKENPLKGQKLMSAETVAKHIVQGIMKRKRDIVLTSQGKMTVFFNKWLPAWMDKKVHEHFAKEAT